MEKIAQVGQKKKKLNYIWWKKIRVVGGNFVICACQPRHLPRHISFQRDLPFIPKVFAVNAKSIEQILCRDHVGQKLLEELF